MAPTRKVYTEDYNTAAFITELIRRYKRKVANGEQVVHHGDCHIFVTGICTCGLLDFILPVATFAMDKVEKIYPDYDKERAAHELALEKARIKEFPDAVCTRCGFNYKRDHYRQGCPSCHCIVYRKVE